MTHPPDRLFPAPYPTPAPDHRTAPTPGLPPGIGAPAGYVRGGCARGRRPRRRRPSRGRRLARLAAFCLALVLCAPFAAYGWADSRLDHAVDLDAITDRAPLGHGTNYLIVGSDTRAGLSDQQRQTLHTGGSADQGGRSDSMILLHTGSHGSTMVSLPRDSWVTLPPYVRPDTGVHYPAARDKLNAAFSLGGPDLLVRTVEHNTGLHIDHYAELGFGGFVRLVDAVGGVRMCVARDVDDRKSGEHLTRGCHTLDGLQALAFVRQRHQEARGDLGRTLNQQRFLSALAHRAATPDILLDPFRALPAAAAGLDTLTVDTHTDLWDLAALFRAVRALTSGNGNRLNVPVSGFGVRTPSGSAVTWDRARADQLFTELRTDAPVRSAPPGAPKAQAWGRGELRDQPPQTRTQEPPEAP